MEHRATVPRIVVAVDPGRDKCGIAVVRDDLAVLEREVAPAGRVVARILDLARRHGADTVVVGDRTSSRALAREIASSSGPGGARSLEIVFIDEHLSTLEGRRRYLLAHPLRGLGKLIPISLRTPREPFDDYVAVVLAERFFHAAKKCNSGKGISPRA